MTHLVDPVRALGNEFHAEIGDPAIEPGVQGRRECSVLLALQPARENRNQTLPKATDVQTQITSVGSEILLVGGFLVMEYGMQR